MQELFSLVMTHRLNVMRAPVKFEWTYSIRFRSYGPYTVNYMELSQGETVLKAKMQKLSSLFVTHHLYVMHAPVKFHEYIPNGLWFMARTRLTIWN